MALRHRSLRRPSQALRNEPWRAPMQLNKIIPKDKLDCVPVTLMLPISSFATQGKRTRCGGENYLKVLLDSGSSGNVISAEQLGDGWKQHAREAPCKWLTAAGHFETKYEVELKFKLVSFSSSRTIIAWFKVHETFKSHRFDAIIGRTTLATLQMVMDFSRGKLIWDGLEDDMWNRRTSTSDQVWRCYNMQEEPKAIQSLESRFFQIVEANYEKADLKAVIPKDIPNNQQAPLLSALQKSFLMANFAKSRTYQASKSNSSNLFQKSRSENILSHSTTDQSW